MTSPDAATLTFLLQNPEVPEVVKPAPGAAPAGPGGQGGPSVGPGGGPAAGGGTPGAVGSPDAQPQQPPPSLLTGLWPILLVIGIMYLVILRPERKRQKDLTKMRSELKKGDRIVTSSGILGTVAAIADDVVTVEIADKVRVQFQRGSVSQILEPKAEPAAAK